VPVVTGISGGLNELFDPDIANQIRFQTGSWDAEYGNKNTAVIFVTSKVPTGTFHLRASETAGSFGTQVQALQASSRSGPFGLVFTGSRQVTDMRQEPVVFDPATLEPVNFHNHGEDLFGFCEGPVASQHARLPQSRPQLVAHALAGALRFDRRREHRRRAARTERLREPELAT
jgi:hypothetical protein